MPGIRVNTPLGDFWTYSLDQQHWQADPVFLTNPDGSAFVEGTVYPVYCRNLPFTMLAVGLIPFGKPSNLDDLQAVAQRGGITDVLLKLLGGLELHNLPTTTQDFPALVLDPASGIVYLKAPSGNKRTLLRTFVEVPTPVGTSGENVVVVPKDTKWKAPTGTTAENVVVVPKDTKWKVPTSTTTNPAPTHTGGWNNLVIDAFGYPPADAPTSIFSDPGDTLTFSMKWNDGGTLRDVPAGFSLNQSTKKFEFADTLVNGYWAIRFIATDSAGQSDYTEFSLTVNRVKPSSGNPAPSHSGTPGDVSVTQFGSPSFTAATNLFSDPGDTLTFSIKQRIGSMLSAAPTGFTLNTATGKYDIADTLANGQYLIRLIATDTAGQADYVEHLLTVNRSQVGNRAPAVNNPQPDIYIYDYNPSYVQRLADEFVDPDGDPISVRVTGWNGSQDIALPKGFSYDPATGHFNHSDLLANGQFVVNIYGSDGKGGEVVDQLLVTVNRQPPTGSTAPDTRTAAIDAGVKEDPEGRVVHFWSRLVNGVTNYGRIRRVSPNPAVLADWTTIPTSAPVDGDGFSDTLSHQYANEGETLALDLSRDGSTTYLTGTVLIASAQTTQSRTRVAEVSNWANPKAYNTTAAADGTYPNPDFSPANILDGDRDQSHWGRNGWNSANFVGGGSNAYVEVDMPQYRAINAVYVDTLGDGTSSGNASESDMFTDNGITDFQVQVPDGAGGWRTVKTINGNNRVRRAISFPTEVTQQVRILILAALNGYARVIEVELYTVTS